MKVERIILQNKDYGVPLNEYKDRRIMRIKLFKKYVIFEGSTLQYNTIIKIKNNLFSVVCFNDYKNYCFRPKWYQCIYFYPFLYSSIFYNFTMNILKKILC